MKKYKLLKNRKYVIYGAAFVGVQVLDGLKKAGYQVEGFLDKRANELEEVEGIKVYEPESFQSSNKEEVVVIVAVTNTFEHPKIADYLQTLGFQKIICKLNENNDSLSADIEQMAEVYDNILAGKIDEEVEISEWTDNSEAYFFKDHALISKEKGYTVAYVPVELCNTQEGTPILYNQTYMIELYRFFEGQQENCENTVNNMKHYFYSNTKQYSSFPKTEQGFKDFIISNYDFYSKMNYLVNMGMNFFIENPMNVYWSDKGCFEIYDNTSIMRVIFFIAKGLRYIPARIAEEGYAEWKNQEKLKVCEECILSMNCLPAYAPILHPNFMGYPTKRDTFGNTRLSRILGYLYKNECKITDKKVIDIGAYYSFFAQAFYRLGAKVTTIEVFESSYEAGKNINELLRCPQINALKGDILNSDIKEKFDITIMLTVLYPYLQDGRGKDFIKKVSDFTDGLLIWESGGDAKEEIAFILENSDFSKYEKIGETYGTGLIRELGVFYKK